MNMKAKIKSSDCLYGHFTAKVEGEPIVAYIERRKAADERMIEEGITDYYVVKHDDQFDTYLFSEEDLNEFLARSAWAWDFHKKEG